MKLPKFSGRQKSRRFSPGLFSYRMATLGRQSAGFVRQSDLPRLPCQVGRRRWYLRRVVGDSMVPTLRPSQIVLLRQVVVVRPGDIVMFSHRGVEKVKRVAKVTNDTLYMLGDNPTRSTDSRQFGVIPSQAVCGRVVWPRVAASSINATLYKM